MFVCMSLIGTVLLSLAIGCSLFLLSPHQVCLYVAYWNFVIESCNWLFLISSFDVLGRLYFVIVAFPG